ncbi:hypothetical protein JAO29_14550 [Edaphobacter sp. HDX4]
MMRIRDWGVNYEEIEPYYDNCENLIAAGRKAGNPNGFEKTEASYQALI